MAKTVHVELPRVVDRDRFLFSVRSQGLDAKPVDRDGFYAVALRPDGAEPNAVVDGWLAETGTPLVPERLSATKIVLRPAGD